jgi:hypothetical protein
VDPSPRIARDLQDHGLGEVSAQLLAMAGPLAWISAQIAYVLAPWLGGRNGWLQALARVLEDPERRRRLQELLQSGGHRG